MHNEELHDLYPHQILFGDQIKKAEKVQANGTYGRQVHTKFWWGNVKEKHRLEERHRWEDNIRMNLQQM
jgi:hypothetical protein